MILPYREHIFDFKNMYFYADFSLRKKRAELYTYRTVDPKLMTFHEMKFIKGHLKVWEKETSKWVNVFPNCIPFHDTINKAYIDFAFESEILQNSEI